MSFLLEVFFNSANSIGSEYFAGTIILYLVELVVLLVYCMKYFLHMQWTSYWHSWSGICSSFPSSVCWSSCGWCRAWGIFMFLLLIWVYVKVSVLYSNLFFWSLPERLKDREYMHLFLWSKVFHTVMTCEKVLWWLLGTRYIYSILSGDPIFAYCLFFPLLDMLLDYYQPMGQNRKSINSQNLMENERKRRENPAIGLKLLLTQGLMELVYMPIFKL